MVVQAGRQQEIRRPKRRFLTQEDHCVVGDGLVQRGSELFPVGEQLVERNRVHDRARQYVRAGLGAFFQHHHGYFPPTFGGQLFEAYRRRQSARSATNDHDVVLHGFAGTKLLDDLFWGHKRCFSGWMELSGLRAADFSSGITRTRMSLH